MYTHVDKSKPEENEKVFVGMDSKPMFPRIAVFRKGKFYDVSDESLELFPTHWKYPNVPFTF